MLNSIKWMMSKNDPKKLYIFYNESGETALKDQIIDRLFEIKEYDVLTEIIKHDTRVRMAVIRRLTESGELTPGAVKNILSWLPISPPHKLIMEFIKKNYREPALKELYDARNLHKDSRAALKVLLNDIQNEDGNSGLNEEYYKLKMLLEESDVTVKENRKINRSLFNEKSSHQERIRKYLQIRKDITLDEEFNLLKNELHDWITHKKFEKSFILTLLNLSRLSYKNKLKLIKEIDEPELYFPENFQLLTESAQIPFESFRNFFSSITIESWLKSSLETNYLIDCLYLKEHYAEFKELNDFLKPISYIDVSVLKKTAQRYVLTKQNGYFLNEIIPDESLLKVLSDGCLKIQQHINKNITAKNFNIRNYLFPLLLIGGNDNFSFINNLLKCRVVDNIEQTLAEIDDYYLQMKQKIHDSENLRKLVNEEIREKENLITGKYYKIVTGEYLKRITEANYLHPEAAKYIVKNIPDLEQFSFYAGERDKIVLCRFISILKIDNYKPLLLDFAEKEDYNVMIYASIALVVLGHEKGLKTLRILCSSPNFNVRESIAEALGLLGEDIPKDLITALLCDNHPKVCIKSIDTLLQQPFDVFFNIVKENFNRIHSFAVPYLIEKLGETKMVEVLGVIIDLMKEPTYDIYLEVIKALGKIDNPVCIELLKNIGLKRNPVLEIERAKSLILLGNNQSRRVFDSFLNYNVNYVRQLAKLAIIRLSSGDKIIAVREFFNDEDPLVSVAAIVKYYHYYEIEGKEMLLNMLSQGSPEVKYNIALLCTILPFNGIKEFLVYLLKLDHYGCRYIASAILAENGISNYIDQMEKNLYNMTEEQLKEISGALSDYFGKYSLKILKKLINLQDSSLLRDQLEVLIGYDVKEATDTLFSLWRRSDEVTKCELAQAFSGINSEKVIKFIRENIENETYKVKAELAYSLAMLGDETGWKLLVDMLKTEKTDELKTVLEKIAAFNSLRALDVLVKHLNKPGIDLKKEIIKSIGSIGMKEALPVLRKYISHPSDKIKISVAKALGEIGAEEGIRLLNILRNDKNQYVTVSVDIAKQKIHDGDYPKKLNPLKIFRELHQPNEWLMSEDWLLKHAGKFIVSHKSLDKKPLTFFKDKVVLSQKGFKNKNAQIDLELSEKLSGCTDIDKIMAAKENARKEKEKLTTKSVLIKSILNANMKDIEDSGWELLLKAVRSRNENIIKAVIIKSCYGDSEKWIPVLKMIVENYLFQEHSDFIIYSLSRKLSTKVLPVLIYFTSNERARYYFVYYCNYFLVNQNLIDPEDIKETEKIINEIELPEEYKPVLSAMLNSLSSLSAT